MMNFARTVWWKKSQPPWDWPIDIHDLCKEIWDDKWTVMWRRGCGEGWGINKKKESEETQTEICVVLGRDNKADSERKSKKENCIRRVQDEVWTGRSREYECWFSGCGLERVAEYLLSTPDSSWQHDPAADLHSCHHVRAGTELSTLLWCAGLYFTSPSISLYLPLHPAAENLFGVLNNPLSFGQSRTVGCYFLYSASSAKVMCCVSQWILPPGCYSHNYLISLKLRAKSWQVVSVMTLLTIFWWVGQLLVIMVAFDLCCWLTNTVKRHHNLWQIYVAKIWGHSNCKANVDRYEPRSKQASKHWHILTYASTQTSILYLDSHI